MLTLVNARTSPRDTFEPESPVEGAHLSLEDFASRAGCRAPAPARRVPRTDAASITRQGCVKSRYTARSRRSASESGYAGIGGCGA